MNQPPQRPRNTAVQINTLQRAAEILGSTALLAEHLRVPHDVLMSWIEGTEPVSPFYFLDAVDIVLGDHSAKQTAAQRLRATLADVQNVLEAAISKGAPKPEDDSDPKP